MAAPASAPDMTTAPMASTGAMPAARPTGVTILAILGILGGALGILFGIMATAFMAVMGSS